MAFPSRQVGSLPAPGWVLCSWARNFSPKFLTCIARWMRVALGRDRRKDCLTSLCSAGESGPTFQSCHLPSLPWNIGARHLPQLLRIGEQHPFTNFPVGIWKSWNLEGIGSLSCAGAVFKILQTVGGRNYVPISILVSSVSPFIAVVQCLAFYIASFMCGMYFTLFQFILHQL